MKVITTNLLNRFWTNGVKPIITNFNNHIKTAASTTALGHVKFGTAAGTACQGNDNRLSNARTPTSHASTGTSYGIGTASNYGHVKLSDTYSSAVTKGAAANGMAASQKALADAYNQLNTNLNPIGGQQMIFNFSNKATGTRYITNTSYLPKNLKYTIEEAAFAGSTGNFAPQLEVVRNGNYIYLSSTNANFAGLTVSCIGTVTQSSQT